MLSEALRLTTLAHQFSAEANAFIESAEARIATCPLVENGVIRIMAMPSYSRGGGLPIATVRSRLQQGSGGWLLDGFPRNLAQAEALDTLLRELGQPIELVVLMELDDAVLIQRLLSRGRSDDNEEVIRHRLEVYREQTAPLISHYRQLGLLASVEAAGSVEEIGARITALTEA